MLAYSPTRASRWLALVPSAAAILARVSRVTLNSPRSIAEVAAVDPGAGRRVLAVGARVRTGWRGSPGQAPGWQRISSAGWLANRLVPVPSGEVAAAGLPVGRIIGVGGGVVGLCPLVQTVGG